jgi:hypothetical protein
VSLYDVSSQQFKSELTDDWWFVAKHPDRIRKQWALCVFHGSVVEPAAYFRTEAMARRFAASLGLKLTDYRESS